MTVSDIIALWGSSEDFSRALGLKHLSHGRTMRRRGSIPHAYWDDVVLLSAKFSQPVTKDDLRAANAMRKPRPQAITSSTQEAAAA